MNQVFQTVKYRTLNLLTGNKELYDIVNNYDDARILISKHNSKTPLEISHIRFNKDNMAVLVNSHGVFFSGEGYFDYTIEAPGLMDNLPTNKVCLNSINIAIKNAKSLIKELIQDEHRSFEREATVHINVDKNGWVSMRTINFYRIDSEEKWYFVKVTENGIFDTRQGKDELLFAYSGWDALLGCK